MEQITTTKADVYPDGLPQIMWLAVIGLLAIFMAVVAALVWFADSVLRMPAPFFLMFVVLLLSFIPGYRYLSEPNRKAVKEIADVLWNAWSMFGVMVLFYALMKADSGVTLTALLNDAPPLIVAILFGGVAPTIVGKSAISISESFDKFSSARRVNTPA